MISTKHFMMTVGMIAAIPCSAVAQSYEITSFTIDAGGGTLAGGTYSLGGTVGQPDASGPLAAGSYDLAGGFWPGVLDPGCNLADLAPPLGTLDLADISVFVGGFTSQSPVGDLNGDGVYDLGDIGLFVTAFTAGCP
jgi:hypothetical protein